MSKTSFRFWDVQHGHATYIQSPNNRHIAVDLGTGSYKEFGRESFSPLLHLKQRYKVDRLHYLIITHPHRDHIDDILNFDKVKPHVLSRPSHLSKSDIMPDNVSYKDKKKYKKYIEVDNRYTGGVSSSNKITPQNYGELDIETFGTSRCSKNNINNHSRVAVFNHNGAKVVVPGDNEDCSFKHLMDNPNFVQAVEGSAILLAPHHGRKAGYYKDFVQAVNPYLTIVSDGGYGDTSHTSAYSSLSRGWNVQKRDGSSEKRYVVTTRKDGVISVEIEEKPNGKNYLGVRID